MDGVRILHISDLHLDSPVMGLDKQQRAVRRQELRQSFAGVLELAAARQIQIVLLPGDLFDGGNPDKSTVTFLQNTFEKYSGMRFFLSPGNHDPLSSGVYEAFADIPQVTVFGAAVSCVELPDWNARVYGAGFAHAQQSQPLLQGFRAADDEMVNLMALHGEVMQGSSGESAYNPIFLQDIAESGLDYLALGHTHEYSGILQQGDTHYAYCGAHEGRGFDECGEKGVILGTVGKKQVDLEFVPTCLRQYHRIAVDVSDCATVEAVLEKIGAQTHGRDLFRIALTGRFDGELSIPVLQNGTDAYFAKFVNETRPRYDLQAAAQDYTLKGLFAKEILRRMETADESQKAALLDAADTGMRLFEKGGA